MALLSMMADKFWKKTGKKIIIQGTNVAGFDKSKVECLNCHKMGYFARECRAPRSQDRGRGDNYRQGSKVEEQAPKALMAIDGVGWDWSYMANDEENHALVAKKEALTEFALMANTSAESKVFDNSLCFKDCKKNTNSLNSKIIDLTDKLFDAKNMIYHYKLGLTQVETRLAEHKDREIKYSEKIIGLEFKTESSDDYIEILKKELDLIKKEKEGLDSKLTCFQTVSKDLDSLLKSQRLDKNKEGLGYSVVPPPPAQIYSSPKKDMSWTGLLEFADDTITYYSRPAPTVESSPDDAQNKNPSVTTTEASPSTISPKPFIKFVKANNSPTNSKTDKAETAKKPLVKYAKQYKKPTKKPNVKGNQRNWNNLKSQLLEKGENGISRAHNNTHKSFTPRPAVHKPYRLPMTPMRSNMNGNISYLSNFEPFDGGYVSFGQGGCKITGKGTIKTSKIEFENMYFVKDLKTPQQNGVAERRNRTLIEAARTMLADAKLPVTFWAEAVNTVYYVQNKVLVNKSQNKTPYELSMVEPLL
nr:ribonuclease H-like domain-containing protein [Tanacetum cinerariifolium]